MADSPIQEIVCCVGHPMAGNPSQFMLQRALADVGLDWGCLTLEVAPPDLEDAIRGIRAFGFKGANLNPPHKIAAIPFLDGLSEVAELIGAANCIHRIDDKLIGENTDGQGFVESLKEVCEISERRVMLLGAGGTARAVALQLGRAGVAEIQVANRTAEHAQALVDLINERLSVEAQVIPWEDTISVGEDIDVLINATAIGHLDHEAQIPLATEKLKPSLVVADVIVNPPNTWLLRKARKRGCTILNGLGMLVNQAVLDFKIWTGRDPDPAVMREAVEEFLEI